MTDEGSINLGRDKTSSFILPDITTYQHKKLFASNYNSLTSFCTGNVQPLLVFVKRHMTHLVSCIALRPATKLDVIHLTEKHDVSMK